LPVACSSLILAAFRQQISAQTQTLSEFDESRSEPFQRAPQALGK